MLNHLIEKKNLYNILKFVPNIRLFKMFDLQGFIILTLYTRMVLFVNFYPWPFISFIFHTIVNYMFILMYINV